MLVAETPNDFAKACLHLYQDENLWHQLQQNAYCAIQNTHSISSAKQLLEEIFFKTRVRSVL